MALILVIDDEAFYRGYIWRLLERMGHAVIETVDISWRPDRSVLESPHPLCLYREADMTRMKFLSAALALALAGFSIPARADDVANPVGYPTLKSAGVLFGTINEKGFYARPGLSVEQPGTSGLLVPLLLTGLCGLIWLGGQKRPDGKD